MFNKKRCKNCGEKVGSDFNYCPYCQAPLQDVSEEKEDWGLLGKSDSFDNNEIRMPFGLNAIFNSLVKSLNKQMQELDRETKKQQDQTRPKVQKKSGGISISISTSGDKPPEIKVRSFGNMPEFKERERAIKKNAKAIKLPNSNSGKFAGLPKQEPETNIRRLSNKVVYEIKMPGVKSKEDLSIIQLENSIEIKAKAGKKVFYKVIPINLPINKYGLSKGILTLELDSKE